LTPAQPLPEEPSTAPGAVSKSDQRSLSILAGTARNRRLHELLPFFGPAFVASVAYVDPGNFGTNIAAGARYGYNLLWVVLLSNLMAMLLQHLSAKLGIATGQNLPEVIRDRFPKPVSLFIWIAAELAAIATNLAEFLGGALGFNLLFHIPLFIGALLTGVTTIAIVSLERHGVRRIEALIGSLVGIIAISYVIETIVDRPNWGLVGYHTVVPYMSSGSILFSAGILGATVMPHAVFLHSALTQRRLRPETEAAKKRLVRYSMLDVVVALAVAGLVNMAMLYMAAATFHTHGFTSVTDIRYAYHTLTPLLGSLAAIVFGISLLASGISSSAVGTMAGQVIMDGFVGFSTPLWLRRVITMVPAIVIIYIGLPTTQTLVVSQVILSLVLPFAVFPLVWFTARRGVMGDLVNWPVTTVLAVIASAAILTLNGLLLFTTFGGAL